MRKEIIFMVSTCGGTGKSFITSALAVALSLQSERKVLIVDTAQGFSSIDYIFGSDKFAVLDSEDFLSGSCSIDKIIYKSPIENVDIIPSSVDITLKYPYEKFSDMINFMSDYYDYIFIDVASWNLVKILKKSLNEVKAIITALPQPFTLMNCPQMAEELVYNMGFSDISLIINKFVKESFLKNTTFQDIDAVIDFCQTRLIGMIPFDKNLYHYSYGEFDVNQIADVASSLKMENKKSALSAVRRIALRIEGNENVAVVY